MVQNVMFGVLGLIIYILLCGAPPFWDGECFAACGSMVRTIETEQGIFEQVLRGQPDFTADPWPSISNSAKDLIKRMLVKDPKKRFTAYEVLCHPWVQEEGIAPDQPLDSAVLFRLKQFSAMNKLKKIAIRVSTQIHVNYLKVHSSCAGFFKLNLSRRYFARRKQV
ncbi:hypothetical protein F3Y22_tig00005939pilonHSYRG00170 [Hibiscus syriacus]|uniref:Protein kinase domain-containing protein n=1 Tax=Hibiscus syriacus TaxID=106335 RepID=A0A6A3CCD0_HIBSY|nr:hypothetical protein F3Y22_tig00005939pilonHSYRG00170 [Hibiscus syriacus]